MVQKLARKPDCLGEGCDPITLDHLGLSLTWRVRPWLGAEAHPVHRPALCWGDPGGDAHKCKTPLLRAFTPSLGRQVHHPCKGKKQERTWKCLYRISSTISAQALVQGGLRITAESPESCVWIGSYPRRYDCWHLGVQEVIRYLKRILILQTSHPRSRSQVPWCKCSRGEKAPGRSPIAGSSKAQPRRPLPYRLLTSLGGLQKHPPP